MDLFIPFAICLMVFILCSLCGWCCRRKKTRGAIFTTPVVVTTTTSSIPAPPGQMAYIGQQTGIPYHPVSQPPQPGFYPTNYPPYPAQGVPNASQMPMPATGYPHHTVPPTSNAPHMAMPGTGYQPYNASQNPPSYDEAVTNEVYSKQSAFNPGYTGS